MFKLKGDYETSDLRLDCIPFFDPRSKGYGVRSELGSVERKTKVWKLSTNLDQEKEGCCVGAAFTHELMAPPFAHKGLDIEFARQKIYWEAQKIDQFPGGDYPGASPKSQGTSVLAGVKVVQKLGYITEYRWAFNLDDLIDSVSSLGPAVMGVDWYSGMFQPDLWGYIAPTGKIEGRHAIMIKGVNVEKQRFRLHNSWGSSWGMAGDCYISWSDMEKLFKNGEFVVPLVRT